MFGCQQIIINHAGHCEPRRFAEMPRVCPHCLHQMAPWCLAARSTDAHDRTVDFAFQCSRVVCRRIFVTTYRADEEGTYGLEHLLAPGQLSQLALYA